MSIQPFIIENAINTCYIDSILVALFYQNSLIDKLLEKEINSKNGMIIYLQEYIKEKFVNIIRQNKSVMQDDMNMIRTLCFELNWRDGNHEEFINQQDANEFYCFLMELFENTQIEITRQIICEKTQEDNEFIKKLIPFIPLALPDAGELPADDCASIKVTEMLYNWLYDNISNIKRNIDNKEQNVNELHVYNITNLPNILALSINRFTNLGERIITSVIIQKKINPFSDKTFVNTYEWIFHAAICHKGLTLNSGHYYSLISLNNNRWLIFDDMKIPSFIEVKMDDKEITDMIKKDCIFLIYRLL